MWSNDRHFGAHEDLARWLTLGHYALVFVRWARWSTAHPFIGGLAGMSGGVGVTLLLVWMLWRYPGVTRVNDWTEGSPPTWIATLGTGTLVVGGGVTAPRSGPRLAERAEIE